MNIDDFIAEFEDVSSDSPDAARELVVEDQDGRLLTVTEIRKSDGRAILVAGEELADSRRL